MSVYTHGYTICLILFLFFLYFKFTGFVAEN